MDQTKPKRVLLILGDPHVVGEACEAWGCGVVQVSASDLREVRLGFRELGVGHVEPKYCCGELLPDLQLEF